MSDQRYRVDRRRFLRDSALVSLGIVAAACAPGGTTTSSGGTAKKGGEFHAAWPWDLPPKGHYNTLSSGNVMQGSYLQDFFIPSLAVYRWAEGKWDNWLMESAAQNGENYEVKLKQGLKWDDGKEFTSADVASTYWVGRSQGFGIWTYADKLETPDKYTVRFHINRPSSLVPRLVLRNGIRPDSQFGTFAKKLQDLYNAGKTTSSDEVKAVAKEVADYRPDVPPSIGPYKIDKASVTAAQLTMVKNPGGLFADKVNFDKIVVYQGETDAVTPLVLAGDVDYATHGFPLATDKAFGDAGLRVIRGPLYTGPALVFHWTGAPEFQDKRLRQAVAMAINKPESAKITYGESAKACKFMCGMSDNIVPLWVSSADQAKLKPYDYDVAAAAKLMTDAGFAKGSDGIWAKGGKALAYELYFPSDFADWTSAANHASDALNKFGIKITPRGAIRSTQLADVNNGKFQIAMMGWGIGNPHPQASYIQDLQTFNTLQANGGMQYPLKQGDTDFAALINAMGDGFDTNKQKDPVTKAAIAFNDLLPIIPLWERYGNNPVNEKKRVAPWPPDSDPIYKNGGGDSFVSIMIYNGTLHSL
ncbi:MAG TPA: ABC transporter substrate-binding protein [Candidatus Limnocylindria bacterium]|nr:ABC transporter substrate-binding protein [Candidatus Limnocylindria bacterium]